MGWTPRLKKQADLNLDYHLGTYANELYFQVCYISYNIDAIVNMNYNMGYGLPQAG